MNDKPTAAPHRWPYTEHRTLEEVYHDERRLAEIQRQHDKNRDWQRKRRAA